MQYTIKPFPEYIHPLLKGVKIISGIVLYYYRREVKVFREMVKSNLGIIFSVSQSSFYLYSLAWGKKEFRRVVIKEAAGKL